MIEKHKSRLQYLGIIIVIIILGLLSRKISFIPHFVGDMLYAAMIVGWFRFLFLSLSLKQVIFWSVVFCFGIEFSQLLQQDWLVELRATLLGKLVLGRGFLWSDLLAYTIGALSFGYLIQVFEKR